MKSKKIYVLIVLGTLISILSSIALFFYGSYLADSEYYHRIDVQYNWNLSSAINALNQLENDTNADNNMDNQISNIRTYIDQTAVAITIMSSHYNIASPKMQISLNNISSHIHAYSNKLYEITTSLSDIPLKDKLSYISDLRSDLQIIYEGNLFKDYKYRDSYNSLYLIWESIGNDLIYQTAP